MNKWKILNRNQNTFFSFADDALRFFSDRFKISENAHGLIVLKIDGMFVSSFKKEECEDAILYYANREVNRTLQ